MTTTFLPFCRSRIDRLILLEHGETIAKAAGVSKKSLFVTGIPEHCFTTGVRIQLHGGDEFTFQSVFLVKQPQHLLVLTRWSGFYVIDRGLVREFDLFQMDPVQRKAPEVRRPNGIGPPKRKPKPRRPGEVIEFRRRNPHAEPRQK